MEQNLYFLPYAISAIVLAAIGALLDIFFKRHLVYKELASLRDKLLKKREKITYAWDQLGMGYRLKIDIEYIPAKKREEIDNRRQVILQKLSELGRTNLWDVYQRMLKGYENLADRLLLVPKRQRLEVIGPVDWPFWLWWKIVYGLFAVFDFLGRLLFRMTALFFILVPWSKRRATLQERLEELKALNDECEKLLSDIKELEHGARFLTQKEREREQERLKKREAERIAHENTQHLQKLKVEMQVNLDYLNQRQKPESLEVGEEGITHTPLLSFSKAKKFLDDDLAKLQRMEDDGTPPEDLIPLYQEMLGDFEVVEVDKDKQATLLESKSYRISSAEAMIKNVRSELADIEEFMGERLESFAELEEARAILEEEASAHWAKREWDALEEDLARFNALLERAREVLINLREWAKIIVPLGHKVVWLKEIQEEMSEYHSIKVENPARWERAVELLDKQVPNLWASRDQEALEKHVADIKEEIELRQQKLATRTFEQSQEMARRIDVSDKAEERLIALHERILEGPGKEHTLPFQTPKYRQPRVDLKGPVGETELGTRYDKRFESAFRGTDAIKREQEEKEAEEEEEPQRPSTLNGLRRRQADFFRKGKES